MKKLVAIAMMVAMVFSFTACGGGGGSAEDNGEVNILMWSNYMADDVVAKFEDETGIKVNFSYMSTSEEAAAKITSGGGDEYDLVMPCDADLTGLINGGYLEEINLDNVPNLENLGEPYKYRKDIDPENKYAIPYLMNFVYVVYNQETCPVEIDEYKDLLDPALKGQIASVTGQRNLFPIALASLGYNPNSTDEDEIKEAYEWLKGYVPNVAGFDSDSAETMLINGVASVGFLFDGQASKGFSNMPEGTLKVAELKDPIQLGVDELVIPAGAKNKENAEAFLNFILDADNMSENLQIMMDQDGQGYACPNQAAVDKMGEDYRTQPALDIPEEMKANYFLQLDVGDAAKVYDKYWTMLMSDEQ
ncbi:MAG: spermidine/putrescine ABC transporter substrate-binding protein [Firmicutes bacterium]|nr:spermidine/putrescine ABC transporter substrate-binding protein [Bacillota bacterium]